MMRLLPYGMLLLGSAAGLQLGTCAVGRGTTGDVAALPSAARPSAALRGKPTPAFLRLCQKPCCTCVPCWLHTWLRVSLGVYTPRAPKRAAGSPLRLSTHTHRSSQTRSPRPARHTWPALILPHPSLAATCRPRATCTASRPHAGSTLRPHFLLLLVATCRRAAAPSMSIFDTLKGSIDRLTDWRVARASHILIKDFDEATVELMRGWKAEVGDDEDKFAQFAKEKSQCPSAVRGGDLGFFTRGKMVKEFDAVVFEQEPGSVYGPGVCWALLLDAAFFSPS